MVDVTFRYNTNLANYKGIAPGKLAVDAGTLITFAQADLSGAQLDLLLRTGRDVVITSTIRTEATIKNVPDARTIEDWITRNANNPHLIIDNSPLNPAYIPQSDNGEISIIGYIQRTGGDIRVVTEDLKWMDGLRPGLAAARDLAGTSGVTLTTNEFVNDLMISGSISPYEHSLAALQILKIDPLRSNPEQQNLLFRPGDAIPLEFQNGTTGHVFYAGPLGAIAVDEHGILIGVPAIFGLRLNIPKSSPLKFTEADHSVDTASLAYGPIEDINGKLAIVGDDTDHSSLLQHARFEYDPNEGTMSRSLVKDDGSSTKSVFDTGTKPWSSETSEFNVYQGLQSQRVDFDNGSQQIKKYDPDNNHPYKELDVTKGPDGQISAAQAQLEDSIVAAGGSVGQIFGSALGRALAPDDPFKQIVAGTVAGLVGQKLFQTFTASLTVDASRFVASNFASVSGLDVAHAGIGAISSFLTAELGHELHLTGLAGDIFNAGAGGVTASVLTQVVDKMALDHLSFDAAMGAISWSTAATQAGYNISAAAGAFLAHAFVPAQSHEGAVGGQLFGAVGSALGLTAVVNATITGFMGFLIPGIGSLFGTIVGTMLGDAIAGDPVYPMAYHDVRILGSDYHFTNRLVGTDNHGNAAVSEEMGDQVVKIANSYLDAVHGAGIATSGKVMTGYNAGAAPYQYVTGWFPNGTELAAHFANATDAIQEGVRELLVSTEAIGGDLLMKRAHQAFINGPHPVPDEIAPDFTDLIKLSGDLSVAQDYQNYLNNREAINALMATNPDTAFTAGWIATFARVNDLGLNQVGASDFLGGLVGYLDSVQKAGLGVEAADATVKQSGGSITVEIKVPNGTEIPGSLSVFADQISQSSDATGTTVQLVFSSGLTPVGLHSNASLSSGVWTAMGGNTLWFGNDVFNEYHDNNANPSNDILVGGASTDWIYAGNGWDFLDGGAGADRLVGLDGGDILRGGTGNDDLQGGQGDDSYVFNRGDGADTIYDDYRYMEADSAGAPGPPGGGGGGSHEVLANGGSDSLIFGAGIRFSDIGMAPSGNDLIVTIYDPAHPNAPDTITIHDWLLQYNKIEFIKFADGSILNFAGGPSTYVLETSGSARLTQVGDKYFFNTAGSGPWLKYNDGAAVLAGGRLDADRRGAGLRRLRGGVEE